MAAKKVQASKRPPGTRIAQAKDDMSTGENTSTDDSAPPPEESAIEMPAGEPTAEAEKVVDENRPVMRAEPPTGPVMRAEPPPPEPVRAKAEPSKSEERLTAELKQNCQRHFPGLIQSEVRSACVSASTDFERLGKIGRTLAQTRCRLNYGEEPRLVMSCLIGTKITEEILSGTEAYQKKLQLCAENYPVHNEIDAFLQESCLTGIHLPELMKTDGRARFESCAQITPERSFIGPCAVGLSLAQEAGSKVTPANQNKLCERYFNLKRFHKGYRACLNAISIAPEVPARYGEAIKSCSNVVSEANNDTERAACLVGLSIFRHQLNDEDIHRRYQKCGDNKVTYQDRDFLACLTAASLLDFTDKNGAEAGCREVFKELRSRSRGDCLNSLNLF